MRRIATTLIIGTLLLGFAVAASEGARAQSAGTEAGFDTWPADGVSVMAQTGGGTSDLVIAEDGTSAWMVLGPRIVVVDLSDPEQPRWRGVSEPLPGFVLEMALVGGHPLVVLRAIDGRGDRLLVFGRDLDAPSIVGSLVLPTPTRDRAFGSAFGLVSLDGRIQAVDVREPTGPRLIPGSVVGPAFQGANFPGSLAVAGRRGYAHIGAEVVALEIGDDGLQVLGSWPLGGSMMEAFEGGLLELMPVGGAPGRILDTSDPGAPLELGTFTVDVDSRHAYRDVHWQGRLLTLHFGRLNEAEVLVYDLSDPAAPRLTARAESGYGDGPVAGAGEIVVVADGAGELHVRRLQGDDLVRAGSLRDPVGTPFRVLLRGDLAVVADLFGNLRALDVADPARPRLLAERPARTSAFPPTNLALQGDVLWMATDELVAWDLSDRERPRTRKRIPLGALASDLLVEDGLAFVSAGRAGVQIFDIADVTQVTRIAHWQELDVPSVAWLARQGQRLWVGGYEGTLFFRSSSASLHQFDIADLAAPRRLAGGAQPSLITGLASEEGVAVVAVGSGQRRWIETLRGVGGRIEGLGQLDLFEAPGLPMTRMHLVDGRLYVADGGLQIVDLRVPSAPDTLGYLRTPGGSSDLWLDASRVALAQGEVGLVMARIDGGEPGSGPGPQPGPSPSPEPPDITVAAKIHLPWMER